MVTPYAHGALLRGGKRASYVLLDDLAPSGGILVLTPHADDETLGCGGAIAAASDAGHKVVVVALTNGAGSHPKSKLYPSKRLVALREKELKQAVSQLTKGKGRVKFLGYPDQGAPHCGNALNAVVLKLLAIMGDFDVGALWTTWCGDPHPDHQAAAKIARALISVRPRLPLWSFPIWGRFTEQTLGSNERLMRFDTRGYRTRKALAIKIYRSQMSPLIPDDPGGFVMDKQAQKHFLASPEYFLRDAHGL